MLHGALLQFLNDVRWGELDYLVLDLPPGTGDVALTLSQKLRSTGAVIVTTPQEVALHDVYKSVSMCQKVGHPDPRRRRERELFHLRRLRQAARALRQGRRAEGRRVRRGAAARADPDRSERPRVGRRGHAGRAGRAGIGNRIRVRGSCGAARRPDQRAQLSDSVRSRSTGAAAPGRCIFRSLAKPVGPPSPSLRMARWLGKTGQHGPASLIDVVDDLTIAQGDLPGGARGKASLVRHHDDREPSAREPASRRPPSR